MGVIKHRPGQPSTFGDDVAAIAALRDPVRLALYEYVAGQTDPVSRDQAAEAIGVSRDMAAFHLDRLADEGLLDVAFRRLSGKQGPGAGRPAKLYSRSAREVQVSLPPRRYDVAARLFAEALATHHPVSALGEISRAYGQSLGARARQRDARRQDPRGLLDSAASVLAELGYEPSVTDQQLVLRNCPFDALAEDYRDVVCTMNRTLMAGLVTGLAADGLSAGIQPRASGQCCVMISRQTEAAS